LGDGDRERTTGDGDSRCRDTDRNRDKDRVRDTTRERRERPRVWKGTRASDRTLAENGHPFATVPVLGFALVLERVSQTSHLRLKLSRAGVSGNVRGPRCLKCFSQTPSARRPWSNHSLAVVLDHGFSPQSPFYDL
jgi:hypothetical protein